MNVTATGRPCRSSILATRTSLVRNTVGSDFRVSAGRDRSTITSGNGNARQDPPRSTTI